MLFSDSTHFCYTLKLISTTPLVKMHLEQPCGCVAMKAPVGLSSRRAVCVSRWKGFALTSVRTATNAKNKNQIPLNMPRVQRRRPLPAAEAGRSCWGNGQQNARAAQGTRGCWEPQPGALKKSPLGSFLPPAGGRVPSIPRTGCMKKSLILRSGILFMTRTGIEPMLQP